ncbi:MAG TPA: ATP-binding protein, partial [Thermoanaerobaculia bacterium]|nr:ATP-binding protein [Thermoanaerobaculia bacterium]
MDDATLTSLHVALSASPENAELRMVLVAAHGEREEYDEAAELVSQMSDEARDALDPKQRRLGAHALLEATEAEAALELLGDGEEPETRLLRARVLLALDRHEDGRAEYKAAVSANAALEDPDLHDRLAVNVRTFRRPSEGGEDDDGPTPLRVYSNDDTTESEMGRLLHPEGERVDFSDVGGLDEVKRQVRKRIILPFEKPSLFKRFKKR